MDNKKKIEVQLEVHDDKGKQKAMKAVSSLQGIESISVDMKAKKLTVIGDVDPVDIICKLRKCGHAVILTVGPAKDPKEEEKKKKEAEEKKKKEEKEKKEKEEEEERKRLAAAYNKCYIPYYPPGPPLCYRPISCEENPNSCVIM
ncbi:heavy metal-associated isoprenylated plant protein 39-like [Rhododendron vialii]|uniref:heavy metal-associated isoprenylated plant protein 39-like n=1 Tax=Rhododendron vialii TaxID=182163 RepID=UPI00265E2C90|nr:heavy metal-associated isoprenylated plant protein 39-like [Rhododendron vialii]